MDQSNYFLVKRKLPKNLSSKDLVLFNNALERNIPYPKVHTFSDIKIFRSVLYKGNKILEESFVEPSRIHQYQFLNLYKFLIRNKLLRRKTRINEACIWFTDEWSHEYFHWLTDALTRLVLVKDKIEHSVILLPEKFSKIGYITTSLKIFGVQQVIYLSEKKVAEVKQLTLPYHTAPTGNYNEELIIRLNEVFQHHASTLPHSDTGERIYVSRTKAQRRKIVNEDEVLALLKTYGFKEVFLEDYSFEEQIAIVFNAKILLSNHGAGLANVLFMKRNSVVMELRREGDSQNNCYFSLCSALNLNYYYQSCKSQDNNQDTFTADLIVDTKELEKNLNQLISEELSKK